MRPSSKVENAQSEKINDNLYVVHLFWNAEDLPFLDQRARSSFVDLGFYIEMGSSVEFGLELVLFALMIIMIRQSYVRSL